MVSIARELSGKVYHYLPNIHGAEEGKLGLECWQLYAAVSLCLGVKFMLHSTWLSGDVYVLFIYTARIQGYYYLALAFMVLTIL